jgi:biopolymer transport protein ExbB
MVEEISTLLVSSGAAWVLYVLLAMSIVAMAISMERGLTFFRNRADFASRAAELRARLDREPLEAVRAWLERQRGVDAWVVAAGIESAPKGVRSAEASMAAQLGLARRELSRGLSWLGTIGSNAPFVGLLGTVIGVVGAFDALGTSAAHSDAASLAPERVMSTIGEALVATAVGLLVAIPAIVAFNHFQTRIQQLLADAETLGQLLVARLHGSTLAPFRRDRDEAPALAAEE